MVKERHRYGYPAGASAGALSRRHLAAAVAGGALALSSMRPSAAGSVFPANYNQVAGTENGILLYRASDGAIVSGTFRDGHFIPATNTTTPSKNWTHLEGGSGGYLFFYGSGNAASGFLQPTGEYLPGWSSSNFGTNLVDEHYAILRTIDVLAFYANGNLGYGLLRSDVWRQEGLINVGVGWTRIEGVGQRFVLYNDQTGKARSVLFTQDGRAKRRSRPFTLGLGWTHIAGTTSGSLVLYNQATGSIKIGRLSRKRGFTRTDDLVAAPGWTHMVTADEAGIFFYDRTNGYGFGGVIKKGSFHQTESYS